MKKTQSRIFLYKLAFLTDFINYKKKKSVQSIFLRNNNLNDEAIQLISFGIGDLKRQNKKLLHLNLSSNKIGDKGAMYLAKVSFVLEEFSFYLFIIVN